MGKKYISPQLKDLIVWTKRWSKQTGPKLIILHHEDSDHEVVGNSQKGSCPLGEGVCSEGRHPKEDLWLITIRDTKDMPEKLDNLEEMEIL